MEKPDATEEAYSIIQDIIELFEVYSPDDLVYWEFFTDNEERKWRYNPRGDWRTQMRNMFWAAREKGFYFYVHASSSSVDLAIKFKNLGLQVSENYDRTAYYARLSIEFNEHVDIEVIIDLTIPWRSISCYPYDRAYSTMPEPTQSFSKLLPLPEHIRTYAPSVNHLMMKLIRQVDYELEELGSLGFQSGSSFTEENKGNILVEESTFQLNPLTNWVPRIAGEQLPYSIKIKLTLTSEGRKLEPIQEREFHCEAMVYLTITITSQ